MPQPRGFVNMFWGHLPKLLLFAIADEAVTFCDTSCRVKGSRGGVKATAAITAADTEMTNLRRIISGTP